ncbi:MAG: hypothetical protein L3K09_04830 [Thermoplasmata archaeon]|nr:hypothetical protein [Thermoplasmata archaeon]
MPSGQTVATYPSRGSRRKRRIYSAISTMKAHDFGPRAWVFSASASPRRFVSAPWPGVFPEFSPISAGIVLIFELSLGTLLIFGSLLARGGRIRSRMYVQSSMVVVYLPVVLT